MINHRLALVVLLGAMSMPGLVWAEPDRFNEHTMQAASYEPSGQRYSTNSFARLDTDRDGRISVSEAGTAKLPEPFEILDRNQDGYLSPMEFRQIPH